MATLLQKIEASGLFSWILASDFTYPGLLWVHLLALSLWAGLMLLTGFRALREPATDNNGEHQGAKHVSMLIAAVSGVLLFGARAGQYAYNPWFWVKMLLLLLVGVSAVIFRGNRKLAVGASLVLLMGAVLASRGPATIRDLMHAVIDPNAEFLFDSVQTISDERGITEIAPQTDAEWARVRSHAEVLFRSPEFLTPGRRIARPRDRAVFPEAELETGAIQALVDAKPDDFSLRALKLREAITIVIRAIDAKDKDALLNSLNTVDEACEGCHVRYWYPNDARAVEAAREAGILE